MHCIIMHIIYAHQKSKFIHDTLMELLLCMYTSDCNYNHR
jgi:hypothetical protein